jgi:hypothetical protein
MRMDGMNLEARGLYIPRPVSPCHATLHSSPHSLSLQCCCESAVNPVSHRPEFLTTGDPLFPLQSGFAIFVSQDFRSHICHPSCRHGSRDLHTPCLGISRYWKLSRILSAYRIRYPQSFGRQLGSLQPG